VAEATSARAALDMNAFGITNVKTMLGGWNLWVERGEKTTKQK
jgi:3-mercaptopyruvate sulfurtransferase SseA